MFYAARDIKENPITSWKSPELLVVKEDISDEIVDEIISPLLGNLCIIDRGIALPQVRYLPDEIVNKHFVLLFNL